MGLSQSFLVGYLGLLLVVMFIKKLRAKDELDFAISNRNMGLFPFVATIVATAYGWIVAVGECYYTDGITAWLYLSFPYMLNFILFAILFAKKARATNNITITDQLEKTYGKYVATFGTLFFLLLVFPAMYVLMSGQILQSILGIGIEWCLLLATLFSMVYLLTGGFRAVVFTDVMQFIIMFVGFAAVCIYLFNNHVPEQVTPEFNKSHLEFNISNSWIYILSWFLLASITLVDPAVNQRVYAAKNPKTATTGIFIAVLCWVAFDAMEATTGIFTKLLLPNLQNPAIAYPELAAQILPEGLSALFLISMLAVIMSTTDSFFFLSALTLSKDVFKANNLFTSVSTTKLTKYSLLLVSILSFGVTYVYRNSSVIDLFFDFAPVTVSVLVVPIFCSYYPKLTLKSKLVLIQMITSFVICFGYQLIQPNLGADFEAINPVFFGLGTSILLQLIFSVKKQKEILV